MNRTRITLIAAVTVFMVVFRPSIFGFDDGSDRPRPLVFPPDSVILGMTYGDWSAAFWQTVFAIPASINPIQETTSANCIIGPSSGPVLFLNPSGVPGALVTRTCSVPAGKPLWLAIVVNECSTIEPPPSRGDNPLELRACAGIIADGIGTDTIKLTIDGAKVRGLQQFRTVSPLFTIVIPETDNLFGVTGVTSGSSVSDGFSVMLAPLSLGRHQIHAEGAFVTGPFGGASFSVTYNLTVE